MLNKLLSILEKSKGVSIDTRTLKEGEIFFALKGSNFDGNRFALTAIEKGAMAAVVDDSSLSNIEKCIYVENVLQTLQQLSNVYRQTLKAKIIAITGSNGKTTTKELIASVLSRKYKTYSTQGNLNNHIGVPLTLLRTPKDCDFLVLEMGANHIGEIAELCNIAQPDYGIVTNSGWDHLEGFGSPEGAFMANIELYKYVYQQNKMIFVNADDEKLMNASANLHRKTYGTINGQLKSNLIQSTPTLKFEIIHNTQTYTVETNLFGSYNVYNCLAAILIGLEFEVPIEDCIEGIKNYIPQNMRSQILTTAKNNYIVLDAYNANPSSMELVLKDFETLNKTNKIAIIGSMLELGKYSDEAHKNIVNQVEKMQIEKAFFIGKEFKKFVKKTEKIHYFENTDEALKNLINTNIVNSTILIKGSRGNKLEKLLDIL